MTQLSSQLPPGQAQLPTGQGKEGQRLGQESPQGTATPGSLLAGSSWARQTLPQPAEHLERLAGSLCPSSQNKSRQDPAITQNSANCIAKSIMRAPLGPQGTEGSIHPLTHKGRAGEVPETQTSNRKGRGKRLPWGLEPGFTCSVNSFLRLSFPSCPRPSIWRRSAGSSHLTGSCCQAAGWLPSMGCSRIGTAQATPSPFCDLELY